MVFLFLMDGCFHLVHIKLHENVILENLEKNINEKFNLKFTSALETSKNYIQKTNPKQNIDEE